MKEKQDSKNFKCDFKCKDCIHYSTYANECIIDEHYTFPNDEACSKFGKRKDCKHRYENCDINGCSIICHRFPSERGCDFYYECKLDNFYCDEKCEIHKYRYEIKTLSEERSKLYEAKKSIEKSIKRYDEKINALEEKLNKKDNKK